MLHLYLPSVWYCVQTADHVGHVQFVFSSTSQSSPDYYVEGFSEQLSVALDCPASGVAANADGWK